jgi:peptidoglycan/LPS O-acetylase OafA/YrhL
MRQEAGTESTAMELAEPPSPERYDFLDILRGLAARGVILHHTRALGVTPHSELLSLVTASGARCVQLFYVISAFSLYLSLRSKRSEKWKIRKYFLRRFFRIAPLWWFAIVVYVSASLMGDNTFFGRPAPWHILAAALFVHGFHPQTISDVVPGGWSIAVETAFYLLLPAIFFQVRTGLGLFKLFLLSIVVENLLRRVVLYGLTPFFPDIGYDAFHHYSDYWFFSQLPVFVGGLLACWLFDFLRRNAPMHLDR